MQQTDKYKLNLIEKTDTFSPEALNQNTQKVEGALAALQTAVDGKAPASLEGRVAALELKKIMVGSYEGQVSSNASVPYVPQFISLGFTPVAVFVLRDSKPSVSLAVAVNNASNVKIVDNGFEVNNTSSGNGDSLNERLHTYHYLAFG